LVEAEAQKFAISEFNVSEECVHQLGHSKIAVVEFTFSEDNVGEIGFRKVAIPECAVFVVTFRKRLFGIINIIEVFFFGVGFAHV
jgi:hypothetical protein